MYLIGSYFIFGPFINRMTVYIRVQSVHFVLYFNSIWLYHKLILQNFIINYQGQNHWDQVKVSYVSIKTISKHLRKS